MVAKKLTDPAKANALLNEIAKSRDQRIAKAANGQLQFQKLKTAPLELKFTAVDGSEVDFSKLRGKVVLVDFWATWCRPCMAAVPEVVEAYKKLHEKGFEVIGISLDENKQAVLNVTKEKGMTWPQYFDGKGKENTISLQFGIDEIPTMWLFNKQGMLVEADTDSQEDLQTSIEKLLAQ